MAVSIGNISNVRGIVIATDSQGNQRQLMSGDEIFKGEDIKAIGQDASADIVLNDGTSMIVDSTGMRSSDMPIDQNLTNSDALADISDLQKAILEGASLGELQETAAGGDGGNGGGNGGGSFGEAVFTQGGHENNVLSDIRDLPGASASIIPEYHRLGGSSDNFPAPVIFDIDGAATGIQGANIVVDEALLSNGNRANAHDANGDGIPDHPTVGVGSFGFNLFGIPGTLNINGLTFSIPANGSVTVPVGSVVSSGNVDISIVSITQSGTAWVVNYSYELTDREDHGTPGSATDDSLSGAVSVGVTTAYGSSSGTIGVQVHDDVPIVTLNSTDPNSTQLAPITGTVGFSFGADGAATNDSVTVNGTSAASDGKFYLTDTNGNAQGVVEIIGSNFTFAPAKGFDTGTDKFELKFEATDSDGDTRSDTIDITSKLNPTLVDTDNTKPGIQVGSIQVDESGLAAGTDAGNAGKIHGNKNFTFDLNGENGTVTIGTSTYTITNNGSPVLIDGTGTTNINGVDVTVTNIAQNGTDGNWTVSYSYELKAPQHHVTQGIDTLNGGEIDINIADDTGEQVNGKISITVVDDVPVVTAHTNITTSTNGAEVTDGMVAIKYGADEMPDNTAERVVIKLSDGTDLSADSTSGDKATFKITDIGEVTIDTVTGNYSFKPERGFYGEQKFDFVFKDKDGDVISQTATVRSQLVADFTSSEVYVDESNLSKGTDPSRSDKSPNAASDATHKTAYDAGDIAGTGRVDVNVHGAKEATVSIKPASGGSSIEITLKDDGTYTINSANAKEANVSVDVVGMGAVTPIRNSDGNIEKWEIEYTYKLSENSDHVGSNEVNDYNSGKINFTVSTDYKNNGITTTTLVSNSNDNNISIKVYDDAPEILTNAEADSADPRGASVTGKFDFTFGADDGASKEVRINGKLGEESTDTNGHTIYNFALHQGNLEYDATANTYKFTANNNYKGDLDIKFTVQDSDGDSITSQTATISIPTPPSVSVKFMEDTNNDHKLSKTEIISIDDADKSGAVISLDPSDASKIAIGKDYLEFTVQTPFGTSDYKVLITSQVLTDLTGGNFKLDGSYSFENIKPDGTTETISTIPSVSNLKTTTVTAVITNEYGASGQEGKDYVVPRTSPEVTMTEDIDNNETLSYDENKEGDGNLKTTTAKIELPAGVESGDKLTYTYTTDPKTGATTTKTVILTQNDIDNNYVSVSNLPLERGYDTIVKDAFTTKSDGSNASDRSNSDKVTIATDVIKVEFVEKPSVILDGSSDKSISRADSMKDHDVNETSAVVTIPTNVRDGDKLVLDIKDSVNGDRAQTYTVKTDANGVITAIEFESSTDGKTYANLTQYANKKGVVQEFKFVVEGIGLEATDSDGTKHETTIKATLDYRDGVNDDALITDVSAADKTSIQAIKAPEVWFGAAEGGSAIARNSGSDDITRDDISGEYTTNVTIKIPDNAVNGDKLVVEITEPDSSVTKHTYTIEKSDANGAKADKIIDENGNEVATKSQTFVIKDVAMKTGVDTAVAAQILSVKKHSDGTTAVDESPITTAKSQIAQIGTVSIEYNKDVNTNTVLSRSESSETGKHEEIYTTTAKVTLPDNILVGDTVKIDSGNGAPKTYTMGKDADGNWTATDANGETLEISGTTIMLKGIELNKNGENTIAVTVNGLNDAKAEMTAINSISLENINDDMLVKFTADTNNDRLIVGTSTEIGIKLPSNVVSGDKLVIEVDRDGTSEDVTRKFAVEQDIVSGKFTITELDGAGNKIGAPIDVKNGWVSIDGIQVNGGSATKVNASVQDYKGLDKVSTKTDLLDNSNGSGGPVFDVTYEEDLDHNEKLSRAETIADNAANTTNAIITLPGGYKANEKVTVNIADFDDSGNARTRTVVYTLNDNGTATDNDGKVIPIENGTIKTPVTVKVDQQTTVNAKFAHSDGIFESVNDRSITLEKGLAKNTLKISFDEDNLNRNDVIDRTEALADGDIYTTTVSVTIPYNASIGDKVTIQKDGSDYKIYTIAEGTGNNAGKYVAKDANDNEIPIEDNAIKISGIPMNYTTPTASVPAPAPIKTEITAKITDAYGDDEVTQVKESSLAQGFQGKLEVIFNEDLSRNGTLSRDEASSDGNEGKTKVSVKLPYDVAAGDLLAVTIDGVKTEYKVVSDNGVLKVENVTTHAQTALVGGALVLELENISVDAATEVKATITDGKGYYEQTGDASVSLEQMQYISSVSQNAVGRGGTGISKDAADMTANVDIGLPDDAKAGDIIKISYDHPDGIKDDDGKAKTIRQEITVTQDNINDGNVNVKIKVNTDTSHEQKVYVESTDASGNNKSEKVYFTIDLEQDQSDDRVGYYAAQDRIYGGAGNDTLVINDTINFTNMSNLDEKIHSFEKIELGTDRTTILSINPKDVLDITDNKDTVLNITKGDYSAKVVLDGNKWTRVDTDAESQVSHEKTYEGIADGHTITIKIHDDVQTDF
ncbi:MAG: retention module-containing protein [Campylobacter sp.]|nr:retention module-containing protein [Campylobacter sp.]